MSRRTSSGRCDDVGLVLADVGQRPQPGDISDRPQPLCRPQVIVHRRPARIRLDAHRLQADPADAGPTPGGDEQPVAAQVTPVVELHDVVCAIAAYGRGVCGQDELNALLVQNLAERLTQRRRLPGKNMR